jgi:uncharacterized membrane protein YcaP (DUF421 family)
MNVPDLSALFAIHVPPLEIIVRGTAVYWFLFLMFRFVLRRDVGSVAITDVLFVVVIADASQNAIAGTYDTISEGFLLVATIGAWNYGLDWAAYHFKPVRRLVEGQPMPLIRDGKLLRRNLRRELLTLDDLNSALREHGVEKVEDVKLAVMESGGQISVVSRMPATPAPSSGPPDTR